MVWVIAAEGKKVLIITKNKDLADTRFDQDITKLQRPNEKGQRPNREIKKSNFEIGTYYGFTKGIFSNVKWDAVIFDEAHLLSGYTSKKNQAFKDLKTDFKVLVSATLYEDPQKSIYALTTLEGMTEEQIQQQSCRLPARGGEPAVAVHQQAGVIVGER